MKSERKILIAFFLNAFFALVEFAGGLYTGSVAILSDAVHDLGDAMGIGISYFLERKSKQAPDKMYTYGYVRYSVLGGVIMTVILIVSSVLIIIHATNKFFAPTPVNYDGMIAFAVFAFLVNFVAAYITRKGESLNQKAVNLHMLEDVLGWGIVLFGAVVMKFTNFVFIDPLLSIGIAVFILIHAFKNLIEALHLFFEKTPAEIDIEMMKDDLLNIKGVLDVHHIHVWSLDGYRHYVTFHLVTNEEDVIKIKTQVRCALVKYNIVHVTIETERSGEVCDHIDCAVVNSVEKTGHHH